MMYRITLYVKYQKRLKLYNSTDPIKQNSSVYRYNKIFGTEASFYVFTIHNFTLPHPPIDIWGLLQMKILETFLPFECNVRFSCELYIEIIILLLGKNMCRCPILSLFLFIYNTK